MTFLLDKYFNNVKEIGEKKMKILYKFVSPLLLSLSQVTIKRKKPVISCSINTRSPGIL